MVTPKGSISTNLVNSVRSQHIWELAPESISHPISFDLNSAPFPTIQTPAGIPCPNPKGLPNLDGFLAAHFVPSTVDNYVGQPV
jgi:hypothetical protein